MSSNNNEPHVSKPIETQPQWQTGSVAIDQDQLSKPSAPVPLGLEPLIEVEEVILKEKVFQNQCGQILFSIHHEPECCGPPLNIWLVDSWKRDVINVHMTSHGKWCSDYSDVQIDAPYRNPIAYVKEDSTTEIPKFSIQNAKQEPVFTAICDYPMKIISVNGQDCVAEIKKGIQSAEIIFHFPMNMEAKLKAVILGAFLYVNFRLQKFYRQQLSSSSYISAPGVGDIIFWGAVDFGGGSSHGDLGFCGCCGGDYEYYGVDYGCCDGDGGACDGDCGGDNADCGGDCPVM
ncbi:phospholipid scramblase 1-like [Discoglossus pictus]